MERLQAEAKVLSHLDEGGIAAVLLLDNRVVILSPDVFGANILRFYYVRNNIDPKKNFTIFKL